MLKKMFRWLCSKGWHVGRHKHPLYGGDGPDDASHGLWCPHCHAYGWRYCDGSVRWSSR